MVFLATDAHLLWQVVWVSTLAGVGISALFSLILVGSARTADARRGGRTVAATVYFCLTVVGFAVFALGVVLGVQAMVVK
jgi:hypothetical protein